MKDSIGQRCVSSFPKYLCGCALNRSLGSYGHICLSHCDYKDIQSVVALSFHRANRQRWRLPDCRSPALVGEHPRICAFGIDSCTLADQEFAFGERRANVPLIQLSTDYVFDGQKREAYCEDDPVAPLGVYGASKEGGEQAVRTGNPRHLILRTAWVVSPHGVNFVKTMLRLAAERPTIRVVDDQRGCPTSAADVAMALITIAKRLIADPFAPTGTYHFVNAGEASWYEFARAIFAMVAARGRSVPTVEAISSSDYPTPARRPANSRLSSAKLQREFDIVSRPWQIAVEEVVDMRGSTLGRTTASWRPQSLFGLCRNGKGSILPASKRLLS